MEIKILKSELNRNGVEGIAFTKILFNITEDNDTKTLIGIFDDGDNFFILDPLNFNDKFRGDIIGREIKKLLPNDQNRGF